MTDVLDMASRAAVPAATGITDCDIHITLPRADALRSRMPDRLRSRYDLVGCRSQTGGFYTTAPQGIYRADAQPSSGLPPGSDLAFLREQLLDRWQIVRGILGPSPIFGWEQHGDFAAALTRALNDWTEEEWLEPEPRLYGSVTVPVEDPARAVDEIRRVGDRRRFVQVLVVVRTREPLGHPNYWPIFEAATEHGLPITVHVGGGGGSVTGVGWPSYHFEQHVSYVQAYQAHLVSLIFSGVFDRIPDLRFVFEEGGFAWVPALVWRLDRTWRLLSDQVPSLSEPPSEIVRRHFWFTTQPMDEPDDPEDLNRVIRHLALDDRLMYASDYPHWDFDSPSRALPRTIGAELKEKIFSRNAGSLFRFDA